MFLTDKKTGIVLCAGDVFPYKNKYGVEMYAINEQKYLASAVNFYAEDIDVTPKKNTYIDGVVGINPDWEELAVDEKETVEEKLDRIEEALAKVSAGGVSAADIEAAIQEGVNAV